MSVATEFAPSVRIPARARRSAPNGYAAPPARPLALVRPGAEPVLAPHADPLASVSVLRRPADADRVAVRLTRRGMVVVGLLVAALGAVLVWIAAASAPAQSRVPAHAPAVVTVQPGDTLWSIAGRIAPDSDPRAVVSDLQVRNHLDGVDLVPGQELHVR